MKKKYQVITDVLQVHGCQIWEVEASNAEEACELVDKGEGEFYEQEIEVMDIGKAHDAKEQ